MHALLLYTLRSCVCACVSVLLGHTSASSSVLQAVLRARGPLAVSDRFGPSCFFVSLSVLLASSGVQCLPVRGRRITQKQKRNELPGYTASGRMAVNNQAEIKYLNLLCSIHPNPNLNKRLSHPSHIKAFQPPPSAGFGAVDEYGFRVWSQVC